MVNTGNLIGKNIDQFRLEAFIGQGAMGIVYKAYDTVLHRTVALKLIPKDTESSTPEQVETSKRLIQEAQAAGCLTQANIVTIHSYGETDEFQYICMEFISGKTLGELLRERQLISVEDAAVILEQILLALDVAYQHHVVHRDIKPNNIMVSSDLKVKVMDFGIAKLPSLLKTTTGTILGTPYYMSPEQISGHSVDIRSDLFSVGTVLYQMITGERPFEGDSTVVVAYKITQVEPVPPKVLNVHIPQSVENICRKALAKDPAVRYQTPAEMLHDLRGVMGKGVKVNPELMDEKTIVARVPVVPPQAAEVKKEGKIPVPETSAEEIIISNRDEKAGTVQKPKVEPVKPEVQSPGKSPQATDKSKASSNRASLIASGLIIVIVIGIVAVVNLLNKGSKQIAAAPETALNAPPTGIQPKPADNMASLPVPVKTDIKPGSVEQKGTPQGTNPAKNQTSQASKQATAQLKPIIDQARGQMQSNPANARKLLEQALAMNPNSFEANYQMARLLTMQNDFENAIPLFQKAGQLDKKSPEVPYYLGFSFMNLGNYEEAIQAYKACRTLSPLFQEEMLVFKDGIHRVKAERALSTALQEEVSNNMGICYLKMKNTKQARLHFREALELNPKNSTAQNYLKSMKR